MSRYFRSDESQEYSDQSQPNPFHSHSSSHSSLVSLPSLPSIPSLTPLEHPAAASHHCAATLKGHSSSVFSLALAGKHLYCGNSDGEIRVWDRNTSSSSHNNYPVAESNSAVKSIAISGDKLFTAHHSHQIRIWKIDNNSTAEKQRYKLIKTLPTLTNRCIRLFSGKNQNDVVKTRIRNRSTWIQHSDAVSALALTVDGSLLYSVSWDRTFKVWRISDLKCIESVQNAHDDAINAVVLSRDGVVYTGSADRKIKIWRKGEKKHSLVSTLEKHKSAVNALALSDDGSVLYSGACDRSIIVWEKDDGGGMAVAGALRGHTKAILCLATVRDLLCSGSADRTVRIWRGERGKMNYSCLAVLEGHRNPVKCLSAALDCSDNGGGGGDCGNSYVVYSGSLDFEVKVWKIWVPST